MHAAQINPKPKPEKSIAPAPEIQRIEGATLEQVMSYFEDKTECRLMLITQVQPKFKLENPLWLLIIGYEQTGKTYTILLLMNNDTSYYSNKVTPNAWIAGRKSAEEVFDPLSRRVNGKCWIIDEMGTVLGDKPESVNRFLSLVSASYGTHVAECDDVVGKVNVETDLTVVWGMTPDMYAEFKEYSKKRGTRYLMYEHKKSDIPHHESDNTNTKQVRNIIRSFVLDIKESDMPLPESSSELREYVERFSRLLSTARELPMRTSPLRGRDRFLNVLENMARTNALIKGKSIADVEDAKEVTITFKGNLWYDKEWEIIYNRPYIADFTDKNVIAIKDNLINNGDAYESQVEAKDGGIIPYLVLNDDWLEFLGDILGGYCE